MKVNVTHLRRYISALTVGVLSLGIAAAPVILNNTAYASLITSRNIEMSSAQASATNVTYTVSFNTISTASPSIQAIIVDFCDNDPLLADTTCTAPGGFSISSPTVSGQSTTTGCNISTFTTVTGTAASARTLELSAGAPINVTVTPCLVSFNVTTVTNPNTANHSFYARIYTYDTLAHANAYQAGLAGGSSAGVVDDGGVALSTSGLIQVTATVQETMTFCVTISAITGTCGGALAAPSITLGHGTPLVLTTSAVDIAAVNTQISTNASGGWIVRMKSSNSCSGSASNGGLSSTGGTTCSIAGNGSSAATLVSGSGKWGMCIAKGANTTLSATYNDTVGNCGSSYVATSLYGMDGNSSTGTASTYGSQLMNGSQVNNEANTLEFVATAANTTPAGVYTANESLIATGTF